jgi:hypothetical protein
VKRRVALAVVVLVVHAGCQYFTRIVGRVRGSDGDPGTVCTVTAFDGSWREDDVRVPLGDRFSLLVGANTSRVYTLEVSCPGYERLFREVRVEACAGKWFSRCEVTDVGILVVARLR